MSFGEVSRGPQMRLPAQASNVRLATHAADRRVAVSLGAALLPSGRRRLKEADVQRRCVGFPQTLFPQGYDGDGDTSVPPNVALANLIGKAADRGKEKKMPL